MDEGQLWFAEAQRFRLVTVPGGRGWPGEADVPDWAADTGAIGIINKKLGSKRRGIRRTDACFFVIPAPIVYALSYIKLARFLNYRVWLAGPALKTKNLP